MLASLFGLFANKKVLLIHFDESGYNVDCRYVMIEIGYGRGNGCLLFIWVENLGDKPTVERHCADLACCYLLVLVVWVG